MSDFWENPDFLAVTGSRMYGCASEDSDVDLRGFVVEPYEYFLGRKTFNQYDDKKNDTVIWGLRKFFNLLEKGSPNAIEILYAPNNCIRQASSIGKRIISNRNIFISRKVTDSIRGFASSEWRKCRLLTKNKETGEVYRSDRVVGRKRKESFAEHGYCTKNAYHSIRLLHQGIDILLYGEIIFPRPNATLLNKIRNGEISFSEIEHMRESLKERFAKSEELSEIPRKPDTKAIDILYESIVMDKIKHVLMYRQERI